MLRMTLSSTNCCSDKKNVIGEPEYMTVFQKKHKHGVIDVWWLYDDGGNSSTYNLVFFELFSTVFYSQLICKWQ